MSSHRFPLAAVVVLIGAAPPTTTAAQAIPAACRPLLDAQRKALMTPHHLYSTDGPAGQSAKARADEMISVGGVSYLLYQGKWQRSPITPKEQVDQLQENIGVAKGSGLILRTEEDLDTGGGGKHHISIRYEYANVRAPAGVR